MQKHLDVFIICLNLAVIHSASAESVDRWATVESTKQEISVTGFTRAHAIIPVATEVAGKVKNIFSEIGQPIPAQGEFACLDDVFVRLDIQAANNEIAQQQNDLGFYKKELSRHEPLVAKQTAAANILDRMNRDLINSQRAMQAANIRKQRLDELKRRHCIHAPADWLVIDRLIEPGQWVHEGEVVAHIGDYSKLMVPVTLTEHEVAALKQKDKILVVLTDFQVKVPAFIEHISPAFDENTRKIPVDLVIKEGLPEHRGGVRVELNLELPTEDHVFILPKKALDQRFEEYWLQRKDGKSIRVNLLSEQKDGKVKINSPEIKVGDQFKIIRE